MSLTKRITLGVTAGALALGAGLGVTSMASAASLPTDTTSTSSASASQDQGQRGPGRDGGQLAESLATKLGIDQTKVTEALKAFRDANKPTTAPSEGTKPDRAAMETAMASSLAQSLGVDQAKITTALTEIRTERDATRATEMKSRLDQAVTDGKLTQAEADAVTKAVQAGVLGGPGGH